MLGDVVMYVTDPVFALSLWGAIADGIVTVHKNIQYAVDDVGRAGGGVIVGEGADAVYICDDEVKITDSNITLDGRGATIKSTTKIKRFNVDGTPASDGGEPLVENVWIQNWRSGDANDGGPSSSGCRSSAGSCSRRCRCHTSRSRTPTAS